MTENEIFKIAVLFHVKQQREQTAKKPYHFVPNVSLYETKTL